MHVRFDRETGTEETRLPSRLPEGLSGIGMGLGSGGKPLTDVLKSLQQITETPPPEKPDPALSTSAKTLADLTPALALIAQQMNLAATANQTASLNPLGAAGIFGNVAAVNPAGNLLGAMYNNPLSQVPPQQQQPQPSVGYNTGINAGAGFPAQQGYANMSGQNPRTAPVAQGGMMQNLKPELMQTGYNSVGSAAPGSAMPNRGSGSGVPRCRFQEVGPKRIRTKFHPRILNRFSCKQR
jgi:hypothetical protein